MAVNAGSSRLRWAAEPIQRPLPTPATALPATVRLPIELRNTVALLITLLLISVISLLFMTQAADIATSGYQISQLQSQRDHLQRDNQALEVELSRLHSLPYIEKEATERLHMTKGDLARVQYVSLDQRQLEQARRP